MRRKDHPVIEPEVREDVDELHAEHPRGLVSPGGAQQMLGLSRGAIEGMIRRKRVKVYYGPDLVDKLGPFVHKGPRWILIPVTEIERYGRERGREVRYLWAEHRPPA